MDGTRPGRAWPGRLRRPGEQRIGLAGRLPGPVRRRRATGHDGLAASAKADTANPCALTTSSAVAAAFGGTVASGKVVPFAAGKACWYQVTASNLGVSGHIMVTPLTSQNAQTFAVAKKLPGEVDIAGVGDDAIYLAATTTMEILKGDTVVNAQPLFISGGPVRGAKVKADTIALARSIAACGMGPGGQATDERAAARMARPRTAWRRTGTPWRGRRRPAEHAVGDVHYLPARARQRMGRLVGAASGAADHVDLAAGGYFLVAGTKLTKRDVLRTGRVPGGPLVVLPHIHQAGIRGHFGRRHLRYRWLVHPVPFARRGRCYGQD